MHYLDIDAWERKQHFEFFNTFTDPYFAVTTAVDVTSSYAFAKKNDLSFFSVYLHACMTAINQIENFKYRIEEDKVVVYDTIHASATMMRPNKTFGFSFINYDEDLKVFEKNLKREKDRIYNSNSLFPPQNSQDCIYCSALPWISFTGHKEPVNGGKESVPKLAFAKIEANNEKLSMQVSVSVNHALVDGYHVGLFYEKFQESLNQNK
ncbi:CatA-like O-acetyltransferase [uncultured Maribacter sp.]|uniref:CatA-like O-acetyltransferase n=1 Tax=uncultured Maribacter sp. TaxID=431308 RepID=UPI00263692AF|nr:CatA-like O-acetyltransferase [uncultured Maribacter sp.]